VIAANSGKNRQPALVYPGDCPKSVGTRLLERFPAAEHEVQLALIEREQAWEAACAALDSACQGDGSIVLLEGAAGTGKSALIGGLGSAATSRGMHVLSAAGHRHEAGFAFGVAVHLFEKELEHASSAAVQMLTPGDRRSEPTFDVLHGLYRLCTKLASSSPLAILIDDFDLADWQTSRLVTYLAERIADIPMALVIGVGGLPRTLASDVFELMGTAAPVTHHELAPLTPEGTAARVGARLPHATWIAYREIHEASGGYPRVIDALTAMRAEPREEPALRLAAWALRHASLIDDNGPGLLAAAAVLGPECAVRHVAALAGMDVESASGIAALLVESRILKGDATLSFEQPAVGDAIEASQAPAESSAAHLQAARVLDAGDGSPEAVAHHLLRAGHTASEWVVDRLCTAAAVALGRGAPAMAVLYLRRALEEPPMPEQRPQVVLELGRAEAMTGEPEAALRLSEGASEYVAGAIQTPSGVLKTARALFALGHYDLGVSAFDNALEKDWDPEEAHRLQAGLGSAHWLARLSAGSRLPNEPVPKRADTPGDRALLALHAGEAAMRGDHCTEVRDLALRALGNGALLDEETADGMSYYVATAALTAAEDFQTAEAALTAAVQEAETRGSVLGFATASAARAATISLRGRLSDALSDARNAVSAERHGWRLGLAGARLVIVHCLIEERDLAGAEQELSKAAALADKTHPMRLGLLVLRGHLHLLEGDAEAALGDFRASGELADAAGVRNPAVAPWRSGAGLASAAIGDVAEAERLIDAELSDAEAFGAPGPIGRALRARAAISSPEAALETLEAAVETLQGSQAALERARALVEFGAALRRSGRRRDARAPLRAGLDLAQRCGAAALVELATRETVAAGARPRRTAMTGLSSLTVRERQVASLANEGLSNREIAETLVVTVKTVEWHLKHAYRKLGVTSRDGLRDILESG
jgi:DNA-binding CsgD family transcriptional regulator